MNRSTFITKLASDPRSVFTRNNVTPGWPLPGHTGSVAALAVGPLRRRPGTAGSFNPWPMGQRIQWPQSVSLGLQGSPENSPMSIGEVPSRRSIQRPKHDQPGSPMMKALKRLLGASLVGLSAAIVLSGRIGFFAGMAGPVLVLLFFLAAAVSVTGLAITRARRDHRHPDRPSNDHQTPHRASIDLTRAVQERSR